MNAEKTYAGMPIIDCGQCGKRHPEGRAHCLLCDSPSLFIDGMGFCIGCAG